LLIVDASERLETPLLEAVIVIGSITAVVPSASTAMAAGEGVRTVVVYD
jgi:hypothetical protein